VAAFVESFNRGDVARLDGLFASSPGFEWYSSNAPGRRVQPAATSRSTLGAYFARRHRAGDRLRLVQFDYNGATGLRYGNFGLAFRRSAADFRGGAWFDLAAKGAISCQEGKLIVLSLGGPI